MRIVVMSDSHGDYTAAASVVKRNLGHCDLFIHLGDGERDVERLRVNYPSIDIRHVSGNCDYSGESPGTTVVSAGGIMIFCTHGHRHGVKSGVEKLCSDAEKKGCRIALFGHTHSRFEGTFNGIYVMNPGSCACPRDGKKPSFGVIEIVDGRIVAGIYDV